MQNCLPEWLDHFVFPLTMKMSSCYSTFMPVFGAAGVLDYCHANRCVIVSLSFFFFSPVSIERYFFTLGEGAQDPGTRCN